MSDRRRLQWLLPAGAGLALASLAGLAVNGGNSGPGGRVPASTIAGPLQPGAAAGGLQSTAIDVAAAQRLQGFLQRLEAEIDATGVSHGTFRSVMGGLTPDEEVLAHLRAQPEHTATPWDYLARAVSDARIEGGRLNLARQALPLAIVEARTGVDRYVLTAIWGIESNYGAAQGERSVVRSLATLAANDTRRASFWKTELVHALRIIERGEATSDGLVGSWAGAMGHTQFMPSTYETFAVDFDGDGRRDIWGRPEDGLASAGNYLDRSGWRRGVPWGFEVALPAGFDLVATAPGSRLAIADWLRLDVRPTRPPRLPVAPGEPLELLLPAGREGPAFLVTGNFSVLLRYNQSQSYALAVGHLADRIAGEGPIVGSWPVHERLLQRGEAEEVQWRLAMHGFDAGPLDGIIGARTRGALRLYQISRGVPADGFASARMLDVLRSEPMP